MPLSAFRAAYPAAQPVGGETGDGRPPFISYRLAQQTFDRFQGCELEFSFTGSEQQLYRLQARCPSSPEDIHRYLTSRYGTPTHVSGNMLAWRKGGVEVTFTPKSGVFTIADVERSKSVAASLMRMLGRVPLGPTAPPTSAGAEKSD